MTRKGQAHGEWPAELQFSLRLIVAWPCYKARASVSTSGVAAAPNGKATAAAGLHRSFARPARRPTRIWPITAMERWRPAKARRRWPEVAVVGAAWAVPAAATATLVLVLP